MRAKSDTYYAQPWLCLTRCNGSLFGADASPLLCPPLAILLQTITIECMKKETARKIGLYAAAAAGFVMLYFVVVYACMFVPSFGRNRETYDEKASLKHFDGAENFARNQEDTEWFLASVPARLEMTSYDGLNLVAFFLPAQDAKGVMLLMHGYHSAPLREYATLARLYHNLGYHVCMPYQRGHGESEGKYVTFGVKERYDCRDWIFKLDDMFEGALPIFVQGISMGCATVVMASGFDDLPLNVRGFIADCGFTEPKAMCYYEMNTLRHIPAALSKLLLATGGWYTKWFAGFALDEYSTLDALQKNTRPMLFIHGSEDKRVPISMTLANYEVCSFPKELYLADGAIHAISYLQQEEAYTKRVTEFLQRYGAP